MNQDVNYGYDTVLLPGDLAGRRGHVQLPRAGTGTPQRRV